MSDKYARQKESLELEQRMRAAGEDYEHYLLADAYAHAAMRRRTRRQALELDGLEAAKRVRQAAGLFNGTGPVVSGPRPAAIKPRAREAH